MTERSFIIYDPALSYLDGKNYCEQHMNGIQETMTPWIIKMFFLMS